MKENEIIDNEVIVFDDANFTVKTPIEVNWEEEAAKQAIIMHEMASFLIEKIKEKGCDICPYTCKKGIDHCLLTVDFGLFEESLYSFFEQKHCETQKLYRYSDEYQKDVLKKMVTSAFYRKEDNKTDKK